MPLLLLTLTLACTRSPDADGDGVTVAQGDCDDTDSSRWDQEELYAGDLDLSEVSGFCEGWCRRDIEGSVWIDGLGEYPEELDLEQLACVTLITGWRGSHRSGGSPSTTRPSWRA